MSMLAGVGLAFLLAATPQKTEPMDVSLVSLIASPDQYHGKLVRVVGYCWLQFEGNALYLSEADAKHHVTRNSLALELGDPLTEKEWRLSGHYALLEGTFNATKRGHMWLRSGALQDVSRADSWDFDEPPVAAGTPIVAAAVAPPFFPDVCDDSAVILDIQVEGNGRVSQATVRDPPAALLPHSSELQAIAAQWAFMGRPGAPAVRTTIAFAFRVMPPGASQADLSAVFYSSGEVLVRRLPCR
jgi:hypothetical protein